jgi:hypothetical protein
MDQSWLVTICFEQDEVMYRAYDWPEGGGEGYILSDSDTLGAWNAEY